MKWENKNAKLEKRQIRNANIMVVHLFPYGVINLKDLLYNIFVHK